jgi:hypothetical protein
MKLVVKHLSPLCCYFSLFSPQALAIKIWAPGADATVNLHSFSNCLHSKSVLFFLVPAALVTMLIKFHLLLWWMKSRDSSVGIALGYGLDDRGSRVRFPAGAGNFCLHHRVQNGSGAHPTSYRMGTRGFFPGDKAAWK